MQIEDLLPIDQREFRVSETYTGKYVNVGYNINSSSVYRLLLLIIRVLDQTILLINISKA